MSNPDAARPYFENEVGGPLVDIARAVREELPREGIMHNPVLREQIAPEYGYAGEPSAITNHNPLRLIGRLGTLRMAQFAND